MNQRRNGKEYRKKRRAGRYLSTEKVTRKGRRHHFFGWMAGIGAVIVILLVAVFVLMNQGEQSKLLGVWRYDAYTEYEFLDGNRGCICLDGNTHYEFVYSVKDDVVYLDFVLDYVTDCQYTYCIEEDKLTLIGGEGTAEVGKIYELTRE